MAEADGHNFSRRRLLGAAGSAAVAVAAGSVVRPGAAKALSLPGLTRRQTVAVFGGGIAGLTAAHELAERGFDVTVYERRAWGGKARSSELPGTAAGGRRPLPGEHSLRVFFGFYRNTDDTMRRIPFPGNTNGVLGNLVAEPQVAFGRQARSDLTVPLGQLDPRPYTTAQVKELIIGALVQSDLPPNAVAYFADRLLVFLSSCDARRLGQWEKTPWTDFIAADRFPADYRALIGQLPQNLQASKPELTSTKFMAWVLESLVYNVLGFGTNGPAIRSLNRPTNEAFIEPWLAELRRFGVRLVLGAELTGFAISGGRITGAQVRTTLGLQTVQADWNVCALPADRARQLWSPAMLAVDPRLARMSNLRTANSNGIQYYLRRPVSVSKGAYICVDSPWAVQGTTKAQFWAPDIAATYGDGRVRDILSLAIANWNRPGIIYGKLVSDCTPDEFAHEVWEQFKRHVNDTRGPLLTDDLIVSWHLGDGLAQVNGALVSEDPLVLPTAGTEIDRAEVETAIANLLLAGDHVKGPYEITNMEAANHSGRRAANAVLQRSGSSQTPAATIGPYRPPEWEPFKLIDEARYRAGLPNQFDTPLLGLLTTPLLGGL